MGSSVARLWSLSNDNRRAAAHLTSAYDVARLQSPLPARGGERSRHVTVASWPATGQKNGRGLRLSAPRAVAGPRGISESETAAGKGLPRQIVRQ
jgi:hypothetical protein